MIADSEFSTAVVNKQLLESALNAPFAEFQGFVKYPTFHEKAGVLWYRVTKNHPLTDGNKRLGVTCFAYFCILNQQVIWASDKESIRVPEWIAAGMMTEKQVKEWVKKKVHPQGVGQSKSTAIRV
jgi:death-on-curing protein